MKSALIAVLVALSLVACGKSEVAATAPVVAEAASGVAAAAAGTAPVAAEAASGVAATAAAVGEAAKK